LDLEEDARPKLIITTTINDFTLQIKSMFFSIVIILNLSDSNSFFKFINYYVNNIKYNTNNHNNKVTGVWKGMPDPS
jgi:uncharacterized protein YjgD (DUF1641 family)